MCILTEFYVKTSFHDLFTYLAPTRQIKSCYCSPEGFITFGISGLKDISRSVIVLEVESFPKHEKLFSGVEGLVINTKFAGR